MKWTGWLMLLGFAPLLLGAAAMGVWILIAIAKDIRDERREK